MPKTPSALEPIRKIFLKWYFSENENSKSRLYEISNRFFGHLGSGLSNNSGRQHFWSNSQWGHNSSNSFPIGSWFQFLWNFFSCSIWKSLFSFYFAARMESLLKKDPSIPMVISVIHLSQSCLLGRCHFQDYGDHRKVNSSILILSMFRYTILQLLYHLTVVQLVML